MKAVGVISKEQLWRFRVLLDKNGERITKNYRDIQKNVNDVYNCQATTETSDEAVYGEIFHGKTMIALSLSGAVSITALLGLCCARWQNMKLKTELTFYRKINEDKGYIQMHEPTN